MANVPENANAGCVGPASQTAGKASGCAGCPNKKACSSGEGRKVDPALEKVRERMSEIKHTILILSGKGGVGKSTFSSQLAWALSESHNKEKNIGILDIDICGPSIPRMMGVEDEEVRKSNFGWSPVYADDNLGVMSVGFMLGSKNDAIIWRGPRKNGLIKQFLTDVHWDDLDILIIDAPPGTSDEHISIAQYLKKSHVDGAVIVTTPQEVALLDVRKELNFCAKVGIPVLGVVENMAGFVCPCCKTKTDIFPPMTGGATKMCQEMNVPFLGSIPMDPQLLMACELGRSYLSNPGKNPTAVQAFQDIVQKVITSTPELSASFKSESSESRPQQRQIDGGTSTAMNDMDVDK